MILYALSRPYGVHMYILCMYIHAYICVHIYVHYTNSFTTFLRAPLTEYTYNMYMYVCTHEYMHMYEDERMYGYVYMCICVYVHTYVPENLPLPIQSS
jgi:hypothetical protein